jgi:DNA repair proteins
LKGNVVYELNSASERPGTITPELETVFGKRLGAKTAKYLSNLREVPSVEDIRGAGFGEEDAKRISALISIGTKGILHCGTGFVVNKSEAAVHALGDLKDQPIEHFRCLALNSSHEVIEKYDAAVGTVNRCLVNPSQVFAPAMINGAVSIIVAHNHPGGSTTPSQEDIDVTKNLIEVGQVVGIKVLDSLVVSRNGYESIFDHCNETNNKGGSNAERKHHRRSRVRR